MAFTRSQLAGIVETISNVSQQRPFVNQCIQIALDRVFEYHDFPYYLQESSIQTKPVYNTGFVQVTNLSNAVTGVGTSWLTGIGNYGTGWKLRVGTNNHYYRVKSFTGATTLVLEQPYQGTTNITGTATYTLYKDEFRMSADVDKYKMMRQLQNRINLISLHPDRFDDIHPVPTSFADPCYEIMSGTRLESYTSGTISGTINTSIITGVGTNWDLVEGLGRFSKIRIGSNVYTVKTVDSATQITIYESLLSAVAALSTYEIIFNNIIIQMYQIPDATRLINYRYFRFPSPLVNDYDLPDMPYEWHHILLWGTLSEVLSQKGDINKAENMYETRFMNGLNQMKLKIGSFAPDRIYRRKSVDRLQRITDGLETPNYDRKYSSP